jgi:aryl-alcohol dehydrogenase-like predicted oxidoreductase
MIRREFLKTVSAAAGTLNLALAPRLSQAREPVREFDRGGMRYRRLGRTDLFVSALGFGAHTDYQQRVRGPDGTRLRDDFQELRTRQTDRAIDLGINVVDVYDEAQQWEPLARLVRSKREKVLIATKFNEGRGHIDRNIDRAANLFGHTDLGRYVVRDDSRIPPDGFENWDLLRKGKAAGKVRAIGIATHSPEVMRQACEEFEGLEFIFLPYNFIHAKAGYGDFVPSVLKKGIGLVGMKPLASGSIVKLDPRPPRPDARMEAGEIATSLKHSGPLMEQAVAKLVGELGRRPEETLAQAALRFVFSQPSIACALTGMYRPEELEENYQAFEKHAKGLGQHNAGSLSAAAEVAALTGKNWLPAHYRWLDERWTRRRS